MTILLAVSKSLLPEKDNQAYWCTYRKYNTQPGDLVIVYVTLKGISQAFDVQRIDALNTEWKCAMRNMYTIRLKHLITVANSITAKDLKNHSRLNNMNALQRNFQATTFRVNLEDWVQIIEFLKEKNPNQVSELEILKERGFPNNLSSI